MVPIAAAAGTVGSCREAVVARVCRRDDAQLDLFIHPQGAIFFGEVVPTHSETSQEM